MLLQQKAKLTIFILILITLLAAMFRIYDLSGYPPGVTADEIVQGYTGYSILKTGKDEWGAFLPINPISFGDYKGPVYAYLTIPSIALFGLNVQAIRLPAALLGVLSVIVMFLVVRQLSENDNIALIAAFFLAIASWNVQYSRVAWESDAGSFFFLLGLYAFLKGLKSPKFAILSSISFGITMFCYFPFKVVTPLFILGLLVLNRKKIFSLPRVWLVLSVVIFTIFTLVMVQGFLFAGGNRRADDAAIFNPDNIQTLRNVQDVDPLPQPWGRVINNKIFYLTSQFGENYLGFFSTTFLFSNNRPNSTLFNIPGEWLLTFWEAVLLFVAMILIVKNKVKNSGVLILLAALAPVPAALTRDYLYAQRSEILLFLSPILCAYAAYFIYKSMKNKNLKWVYVLALSVLIFVTEVVQIDYYLFHEFNQNLGGLHYGYDQAVAYTQQNINKYNQIIFTKEHSEPQAFVAFYSKMDPTFYQSYSKNWNFEQQGMEFEDMADMHLGKYFFTNITWNNVKDQKNTLVVAAADEAPSGITPLKTIYDNQGNVMFEIFDTNHE